MRYLAVLTLACVSCSPVPLLAVELVGDVVTVTPAERHTLTQCHRQGGCLIVTQAEVVQVLRQVQQQTMEAVSDYAAQRIDEAEKSCLRGKS